MPQFHLGVLHLTFLSGLSLHNLQMICLDSRLRLLCFYACKLITLSILLLFLFGVVFAEDGIRLFVATLVILWINPLGIQYFIRLLPVFFIPNIVIWYIF